MNTQPNTRRKINWMKETFRSGPLGLSSSFSLDSTKLSRMHNSFHWTPTQWEHLKAMCYLGCSTNTYIGINPRWRMAIFVWMNLSWRARWPRSPFKKTFVYFYFLFPPSFCMFPSLLFFPIDTSNLLTNLLTCFIWFL
jgi:hypothetical protein